MPWTVLSNSNSVYHNNTQEFQKLSWVHISFTVPIFQAAGSLTQVAGISPNQQPGFQQSGREARGGHVRVGNMRVVRGAEKREDYEQEGV